MLSLKYSFAESYDCSPYLLFLSPFPLGYPSYISMVLSSNTQYTILDITVAQSGCPSWLFLLCFWIQQWILAVLQPKDTPHLPTFGIQNNWRLIIAPVAAHAFSYQSWTNLHPKLPPGPSVQNANSNLKVRTLFEKVPICPPQRGALPHFKRPMHSPDNTSWRLTEQSHVTYPLATVEACVVNYGHVGLLGTTQKTGGQRPAPPTGRHTHAPTCSASTRSANQRGAYACTAIAHTDDMSYIYISILPFVQMFYQLPIIF